MMRTIAWGMSFLAAVVIVSGCGDNLAGPVVSVSAPQDLKAFSANETSISLQWSAPIDADSGFQGYTIEYGSFSIELSKNQLVYVAGSLPPGETLFNVFSRKSNGDKGDGALIRWAPAARFDSSYVLTEYAQLDPTRQSGMNVGSRTTTPFTLQVNGTAGNVLDFLCDGGVDNTGPLTLVGADVYGGSFRPTRFSIRSDSSPSLDLPLAVFPADSTFTLGSVAITNNSIYYARVLINSVELHYVRIHVSVVQGSASPLRQIIIRLSLQRTTGIPYADATYRMESWRTLRLLG